MAIDYVGLATTAQGLIEDNGRPMTFSRKGRSAQDTSKPWRTTDSDEALSYSGVIAVVVPEDVAPSPGELTRRPRAVCYVAHNSFPDSAVDVRTLDAVSDSVWTWRIESVSPIMPGTVPVIYVMQLVG